MKTFMRNVKQDKERGESKRGAFGKAQMSHTQLLPINRMFRQGRVVFFVERTSAKNFHTYQ